MPDIQQAPSYGGVPPPPPISVPPPGGVVAGQDPRERKEERRRERRARRERRQRQRQTELSNQLDAYMYEGGGAANADGSGNVNGGGHHSNLPDLVNNPPPPPYATLPPQGGSTSLLCPGNGGAVGGNAANSRGGGWRASISSFSRRRRRCGGEPTLLEEETKPCCGVLVSQSVSIRWFIVMIAFVGICCAVVGTVLGAMKATGREHLTVSLLMIGVGVVLITVSGIAWRMTSRDAPSCRAMMGLDPHAEYGGADSRFLQPPRGGAGGLPYPTRAAHHPYAGMMYSEFQYRPPPPSYQASMQEYRLRLLLMDRSAPVPPPPVHPGHHGQPVVSPPPAYRGMPGRLGLPPLPDVSRPPSYRSRASDPSSHHLPAIIHHARHSSQLSYLSQQTIQEDPAKDATEHASVVPVLHNTGNMHKASIIISGEGEVCGKENYISNIQNQFDTENHHHHHHHGKDFGKVTAAGSAAAGKNTSKPRDDVTIVQKEEERPETGAVVVTVSAAVDRRQNSNSSCSTPEVDILAHL